MSFKDKSPTSSKRIGYGTSLKEGVTPTSIGGILLQVIVRWFRKK